MSGGRVLDEHHLLEIIVLLYPRYENFFLNLLILFSIDFEARFNEVRRHDFTIACNCSKHHHGGRVFGLHNWRNIRRVICNNSKVSAIRDFIDHEFPPVHKDSNMTTAVLQVMGFLTALEMVILLTFCFFPVQPRLR